jgi:hypothetical protein
MWPQLRNGFGQTLGANSGAAIGDAAFSATGLNESIGSVNDAGTSG